MPRDSRKQARGKPGKKGRSLSSLFPVVVALLLLAAYSYATWSMRALRPGSSEGVRGGDGASGGSALAAVRSTAPAAAEQRFAVDHARLAELEEERQAELRRRAEAEAVAKAEAEAREAEVRKKAEAEAAAVARAEAERKRLAAEAAAKVEAERARREAVERKAREQAEALRRAEAAEQQARKQREQLQAQIHAASEQQRVEEEKRAQAEQLALAELQQSAGVPSPTPAPAAVLAHGVKEDLLSLPPHLVPPARGTGGNAASVIIQRGVGSRDRQLLQHLRYVAMVHRQLGTLEETTCAYVGQLYYSQAFSDRIASASPHCTTVVTQRDRSDGSVLQVESVRRVGGGGPKQLELVSLGQAVAPATVFDVVVLDDPVTLLATLDSLSGHLAAGSVATLVLTTRSFGQATMGQVCPRLLSGGYSCTDSERRLAAGGVAPGAGIIAPVSCATYTEQEIVRLRVETSLVCTRFLAPPAKLSAEHVKSVVAGGTSTMDRAAPALLPLIDAGARPTAAKATWAPFVNEFARLSEELVDGVDLGALWALRERGVKEATGILELQQNVFFRVKDATVRAHGPSPSNRLTALTYVLGRFPEVRTVCATGFLFGGDAVHALAVNSAAHVHAFAGRTGEHVQRAASDYIASLFPGRLTLHAGDIRTAFASFTATQARCDLLILGGDVEGETPVHEMQTLLHAAAPNAIVLADNYGLGSVSAAMQHVAADVDWQECLLQRKHEDEAFCFGRARAG